MERRIGSCLFIAREEFYVAVDSGTALIAVPELCDLFIVVTLESNQNALELVKSKAGEASQLCSGILDDSFNLRP